MSASWIKDTEIRIPHAGEMAEVTPATYHWQIVKEHYQRQQFAAIAEQITEAFRQYILYPPKSEIGYVCVLIPCSKYSPKVLADVLQTLKALGYQVRVTLRGDDTEYLISWRNELLKQNRLWTPPNPEKKHE